MTDDRFPVTDTADTADTVEKNGPARIRTGDRAIMSRGKPHAVRRGTETPCEGGIMPGSAQSEGAQLRSWFKDCPVGLDTPLQDVIFDLILGDDSFTVTVERSELGEAS